MTSSPLGILPYILRHELVMGQASDRLSVEIHRGDVGEEDSSTLAV